MFRQGIRKCKGPEESTVGIGRETHTGARRDRPYAQTPLTHTEAAPPELTAKVGERKKPLHWLSSVSLLSGGAPPTPWGLLLAALPAGRC